jgi:hypothetical protein
MLSPFFEKPLPWTISARLRRQQHEWQRERIFRRNLLRAG